MRNKTIRVFYTLHNAKSTKIRKKKRETYLNEIRLIELNCGEMPAYNFSKLFLRAGKVTVRLMSFRADENMCTEYAFKRVF